MTVFIEFSVDTGLHHLMVRDRMGSAPAGARLWHGGDHWPEPIHFAHEDAASAAKDRDRLQKYLDENPARRGKK